MRTLFLTAIGALCLSWLTGTSSAQDKKKLRVLIIDGQNNHAWKQTTPVLKKALEDCGRFTVTVATSPERVQKPPMPKDKEQKTLDKYEAAKQKYEKYRDELAKFHPDLGQFDVVVSNYNGELWGEKLVDDFDRRLNAGEIGFVVVHAANNSFVSWENYRRMVGMGWYDRSLGDRLMLDDNGKQVIVPKGKGDGPAHKYVGKFSVVIRDTKHPVTKDMPMDWMHNNDELYDNMRGPIENVQLLATAYSRGTKAHEPMIWTVTYGKGRVFHTPMGHDVNAMLCVGFQTTLQRGAEWAATGDVTIPLPKDFPTADKVSVVTKAK